MFNSNPVCQSPFFICEECFSFVADLLRYLYLVGPSPINQVLERTGFGYKWATSSGTGWPTLLIVMFYFPMVLYSNLSTALKCVAAPFSMASHSQRVRSFSSSESPP